MRIGDTVALTVASAGELRIGDVVEVFDDKWPVGTVVRGPVWNDERWDYLRVGSAALRTGDGGLPMGAVGRRIKVIERRQPVYVNHSKLDAHAGDVVTDATLGSSHPSRPVWMRASSNDDVWYSGKDHKFHVRDALPEKLRLLVNGETGSHVPHLGW